ncbi:MAG TPA: FecR domain-containing protein [Chitinophagaceae bacterium]
MKPDSSNRMDGRDPERIAFLIAGFLRQTLTEAEHDELDDWMNESPANQRLFEKLTDPDAIEEKLSSFDEPDTAAALQLIKQRMHFADAVVKPIRSKRRMWYAAAASLVLLVGLFFLYTLMNNNKPTIEPVTENELQPGGNYAMLTLANGQKVNLRNAANGLIDSSSGSEVMKTADGQLSYENPEARMIAYHELATEVGGQYSVVLPDGSRVWLNSSSKLRYPVAFAGKERVVELEGEGYFEVAQLASNSSQGEESKIPFIVKVDGMEVKVLGTIFNVNAYKDEDGKRTTLIEGSVKLRRESADVNREMGESVILRPGQQAKMTSEGHITEVKSDVDVNEVIAWKNGKFQFKDEPIETIMRQVGRWYGAEVLYEDKVDFHFNATIYRKEPVERLLEVLEETGRVKFRVEGKRIYVKG